MAEALHDKDDDHNHYNNNSDKNIVMQYPVTCTAV